MIQPLFDSVIYNPLYNTLAFLVGVVPGGDVGVAIIALTLLIKVVLFPLSIVAIKTQVAMREIDPELKALKKEYKDDREALAKKTMALLKDKKVNPFASIFLILIQLPIIFGLYFVFLSEAGGASFDIARLYSFVVNPEVVSFSFLGVIDLTGRNILLALIVAVTQFINARLMMPTAPQGEEGSMQHDLAKSMHIQMRYVFPIIMGAVAYAISAAIALYFVVSNLFALFQELYVKHTKMRGAHNETSAP